MNIFYTSDCPIECAKNLDDKRVIKMCLETAQLLSSALHLNNITDARLYRLTHKGHPCTKWAASNIYNYRWLLKHFEALCSEYKKRYNKTHASYKKLNVILYTLGLRMPKAGEFTPPPNCAGNKDLNISYKDMTDTAAAYWLYLGDRWEADKRAPTWHGVGR